MGRLVFRIFEDVFRILIRVCFFEIKNAQVNEPAARETRLTCAVVEIEEIITNAAVQTRRRDTLVDNITAVEASVAWQTLAVVSESRRHTQSVVFASAVRA